MGAAGFAASGALSIFGGVLSAQAAESAGAYNNAMAQFDARQLDEMAADAINRGEQDAQRIGLDGRRLIGEQRADAAGQGIDVSVGSAADLQLEAAQMTERDVFTARYNAMQEAKGLRTKAVATREQGRMAQRQGHDQATGSLLTGGAQAIAAAAQGVDSYQSRQNAKKAAG